MARIVPLQLRVLLIVSAVTGLRSSASHEPRSWGTNAPAQQSLRAQTRGVSEIEERSSRSRAASLS
jgi:hypothetical protein